MALNHTLTHSYTYDDGTTKYSRAFADSQSGGTYIKINESIPDSSTDLQVVLAIDISQLKLFLMKANGAILVETNSGSTPDDTFNLTATNGVAWSASAQAGEAVQAQVLSTDITTDIYVTNSSGAAVTLEIFALIDPTI